MAGFGPPAQSRPAEFASGGGCGAVEWRNRLPEPPQVKNVEEIASEPNHRSELRGDRSQALELNRKACSANIGALDRTADFIFDEDDIEVEDFEL